MHAMAATAQLARGARCHRTTERIGPVQRAHDDGPRKPVVDSGDRHQRALRSAHVLRRVESERYVHDRSRHAFDRRGEQWRRAECAQACGPRAHDGSGAWREMCEARCVCGEWLAEIFDHPLRETIRTSTQQERERDLEAVECSRCAEARLPSD